MHGRAARDLGVVFFPSFAGSRSTRRAPWRAGRNYFDRSYDLVMADGKLPDGSGIDVCDAAAEKGIKYLIVTGYAFSLPAGTADRTTFY
jgi:hypothetical protein